MRARRFVLDAAKINERERDTTNVKYRTRTEENQYQSGVSCLELMGGILLDV